MSCSSLEGDFPYSLSKLWHLQATAVRTVTYSDQEAQEGAPGVLSEGLMALSPLLRERQSSASTVGTSLESGPNENDSIRHVWRVAITIS